MKVQDEDKLRFEQVICTDKKQNNHFVNAAGVDWSNLLDQSDSDNVQAFTERTTSAKFDFNF